jgi:hypothetical protein
MVLGASFLVLLSMPRTSFADYSVSFQKGYQALDRKQYAEAAVLFREALQEHSQEGGDDVKITGTFFIPYLPHYFLGVALVGQGDCGGALNAWQESERQGYIARTPRIKELRSYKEQCLGPVLAQRFQSGQSEIAEAEREQSALRSLPSGLGDRQRWRVIADLEIKAQEQLALARKKLEEGQRNRNPDTLAEAKGLATSAGKEFRSLKEEGRALIAQAQQAPAPVPPRPVPEAPRSAPPVPAPSTPAARQAEVSPSSTPPSPVGPSPLPQTPAEALSRKPVPESLLAAVRAYFAGDYPRTLKLLDGPSFPDRRANAQAKLFRAAARMALYWRGADRAGDLLAAAQREIRDGRRLDPGLKVDARAFSPRFRSFFDGLR